MKMKKLCAFALMVLISSMAYASKSCMSYHSCDGKHDYHTLKYVQCNCPCKRYKRLPHGQCSYCGHYRYIDDMIVVAGKVEKLKTEMKHAQLPKNVVDPKLYKVFGDKQRFNRE